ncbi:hypothetical protein JK359_36020 [Streptomyces actinomycinicus]|uniref:Uncharacterized protein n=1 Tax=Streptomyces actinomycinicus TaxID=1695166 RepID=A0A937JTZ1_9ACTN|nr:hypothetical protein [Streptomyces actinomycinicus]
MDAPHSLDGYARAEFGIWSIQPDGCTSRQTALARDGKTWRTSDIPDGGGHKIMDRRQAMDEECAATNRRRSCHPVIGYSFIPSAVVDHFRLAHSEVLTGERKETAAGFWQRRTPSPPPTASPWNGS